MWWNAFKYIFFGALFGLAGSVFVGSDQGFAARSEPAQLIVLQLDSRRDADRQTMYRPVFGLVTAARPRPEHAGNVWTRPAPHQPGDIVAGRYDPRSGEMRSDGMSQRTLWLGRIAQVIGMLTVLQGILMLLGIPEILLPLRVRAGT